MIDPECSVYQHPLLDALGKHQVCVIHACASVIDTELNYGPCSALSKHDAVEGVDTFDASLAEIPGCESARKFASFQPLQYGQTAGNYMDRRVASKATNRRAAAHSIYRRFAVTKPQVWGCLGALYGYR